MQNERERVRIRSFRIYFYGLSIIHYFYNSKTRGEGKKKTDFVFGLGIEKYTTPIHYCIEKYTTIYSIVFFEKYTTGVFHFLKNTLLVYFIFIFRKIHYWCILFFEKYTTTKNKNILYKNTSKNTLLAKKYAIISKQSKLGICSFSGEAFKVFFFQ